MTDDSREADGRELERRLRDLRGRVQVAREVIAWTPGLFEMLARDPEEARMFCTRYGITERMLVHGVDAGDQDVRDGVREPVDPYAEVRERASTAFPSSWNA